MSTMKAEWSMTSEWEARPLLAVTLTFQCASERCHSSILLHPVGLHTPTFIVPSGNDFLQTETLYALSGILYELCGSCCSPCRKYLLFGKITRPNVVVDSKFSLAMVSIFLSQDEEKYDHQTIKFCLKRVLSYVKFLCSSFSSTVKGWWADT